MQQSPNTWYEHSIVAGICTCLKEKIESSCLECNVTPPPPQKKKKKDGAWWQVITYIHYL